MTNNPKTSHRRPSGLCFSCDEDDGIRRKRTGHGFRYVDADGKPVRDEETIERIKSLVIPPAWEDVWICALPGGHIQATGRDTKGRKQYRYHNRWRSHREEVKFGALAEFGRSLPTIRERVEADLHRHDLPREKILAAIIALLERTSIRVGNDEYARSNQSYGLTTLRDKHVAPNSTAVRFRFKGKSGKEHNITLQDRRLAKIVKRCQDLPGQRLFVYQDDNGEIHPGETTEEKVSLSERFGLWLSFYPFDQDAYLAICERWLAVFGVSPKSAAATRQQIRHEALQWARMRGSRSRSGPFCSSRKRLVRKQRKPRVTGCCGSPRRPVTTPPSTVARMPHTSGQSRLHVVRCVSVVMRACGGTRKSLARGRPRR